MPVQCRRLHLRVHACLQVLALLRHAVDAVLWQVAVARRDGVGVRRVERMVAEFIDAADADLVKLSQMAKG